MLVAFVFLAGAVIIPIIGQVVAYRATGCATQACADGRTGAAAQVITDDGTASSPNPAAQRRFRSIAFSRAYRTAGCATYTRADGRARRATKLLAHHIAQHAAYAAAQSGCAIAGSRGPLGDQDAQCKGRESHFHFFVPQGLSQALTG